MQAARFFAKDGAHPLAHFPCGFVGEGESVDAVRRITRLTHQPGDFLGDDASLATAGAGNDEQRTAEVGDGFGLLGIQGGNSGGHKGAGCERAGIVAQGVEAF